MSQRQINPEAALDLAGEQFEHASGTGAEIQQRADRLVGERGANRRFDRGIGDVQLADPVPFGGVAAEIILRRCGAGGTYRGKPLAVARDDRIVGVEARDQSAGDIGGVAVLAEAEERPRTLAMPLNQAGFG